MMNLFDNLTLASMVPGHHNLTYHLVVILIAALAAFIPRYFPMHFFTNRKIPEWFDEWMKYVPVALFTSLVVKGIFVDSKYQLISERVSWLGNILVYGHATYIISAIFVMLVAYFTRSMAFSVIIGLLAVWLLSFI
ncbi:branched-chain amino acid transport [Limosilactobacillus secaliphilus]|uniref:Branched-chain amino acid transport n=2 Tax=Limosilactobacillus secaliphilus TaxID=396268 RepID=A0A0R2I9A2_9LACO|nr:branched-chain amino acid transport [Limosilactobacillus secaliphilus]